MGSSFVSTPRSDMRTAEYGQKYQIGYDMQALEQERLNLQRGVEAERRESPLFQRGAFPISRSSV